ncbi:MAG: APC family permease [Chloroflexi bacterium]|nr:MAG: APC family permease [Chloroflexota bacterium]
MVGANLRKLLIGKPLETEALPHQAVSKPVGLALFASDALSSTAYATEEILIILALAGLGKSVLGISIPIAIATSILLIIVTISYRQTIYAYPNGGGAYIVARDNLGEIPAQIAGSALLTDYILTVAVSITAGVAQITSGFPILLPYRVYLAVGIIVLMTVVNLRGVKESGRIFSVPTYFFLSMMFLTLGVGIFRALSGNLPSVTEVDALEVSVAQPLTLFLILRAFSSGSTALTGIEAISNGITAFKKPSSHNAAVTLVWLSSMLILLFLGITFLANQIGALPSETETIISQIGRTVYGENSILYLLTLVGTSLILLMAANTSFADFPRLAALEARDGFLPRQLTFRGSRLVFSWGIVVLALFSSVLVILADARTTRLIPLYAIGVFLSFTLSQSGMAIRFRKSGRLKPGEEQEGLETSLRYEPGWRYKMIISGFGAVCTGIVMIVFAVTKFTSGAWFTVLLIPSLSFLFLRVHRHYQTVAHNLSLAGVAVDVEPRGMHTIILVDDVHAETARLVNFAKSLSHDWRAVHIGIHPDKIETVRKKWQERIGEGELVVLDSPYRQLAEPLIDYINTIRSRDPDSYVHVIMGHLVMNSFWEQALHQNSAVIFNLALSHLDNVVVTNVPYQIRHLESEAHNDEAVPDSASEGEDAPEAVSEDDAVIVDAD